MSEEKGRLKRRWLYIPFAIAGVIIFVYYLTWRAGSHQMKLAVEAWVSDQRQSGLTVEHGSITSSGFPFFLRVHIDDPEIQSGEIWYWGSERLSLDALPYDLNKIIFSSVGKQVYRTEYYGEWTLNAEDMRASISKDRLREWVFSMNVAGATATRTQDDATLCLKKLIFDLAPAQSEKSTLTLNLAAAQFDANANGETYSLTTLQTAAALSQSQLLSLGTDVWRDAGGSLEIAGLFADVEKTKISAYGEIKVDVNDRPTGTIDAAIENPAGFARMLGKTNAMTENEAEVAAAGLSLMAFAAGGTIETKIQLQDGKALIQGIKIADLPKVNE